MHPTSPHRLISIFETIVNKRNTVMYSQRFALNSGCDSMPSSSLSPCIKAEKVVEAGLPLYKMLNATACWLKSSAFLQKYLGTTVPSIFSNNSLSVRTNSWFTNLKLSLKPRYASLLNLKFTRVLSSILSCGSFPATSSSWMVLCSKSSASFLFQEDG